MADDIKLVIGVDDRDLIRTQKEQKKFERNLLIIEAAFRKGDITAKRYSSELNRQAKNLSRLGGTYKKANSEVRVYASSIRKLTDDKLRLTMAQNVAGKSTNKFGMYAQQVGYQVGDFFVQVQSGTSALVAFGQQGTQLAGLLPGVYGAVIGISLAVGTMLLRSFNDASGAGKNFSKALEDTESAMKKYSDLIKKAAKSTRELSESFGGFSDVMKSVLSDLEGLSKQEAIKNFKQQIDNLSIVSLGFKGTLVKIIGGVHGAATATKFFAKELGLTLEQFTSISKLSDATKTGPIEDRVKAALKLRDSILEVTGGTKNMTDKMSEYFTNLLKSVEAGAELTAILDGTALAAKRLNAIEEHRLNNTKLYYDYQERLKKIQEDLAKAVQKIVDKNKELNRLSDLEVSNLSREIDMLAVKLTFGEKSLKVKALEKSQLKAIFDEQLKVFEIEMLRKGHSQAIVDGLIRQKQAAFGLKTELLEVADASREIARLAAMTDKEYQNMLYSQAYAASRLAAPKTPVKHKDPKKTTKKTEAEKIADTIAAFQKQLDLEDALFGKSEARRKVLQALGEDIVKSLATNNPKIVSDMEAQIVANQKLIDLEQQRQSIIDSVTGSVENGMMAMVDGTLSVKDAFKSMASEIIKELYRVLVVQKLVAAAKTAIMGFAEGGVISDGNKVTAYANGGIVGSPTTFPMSGGKTGLMGEAGPEAIMPLKRGANGKLGVQMEGGKGGDNIVIHQNFNFQANGDDTVKKLIAQAAPKIMSMTKTSLIEDRRRGGSTKAAFG